LRNYSAPQGAGQKCFESIANGTGGGVQNEFVSNSNFPGNDVTRPLPRRTNNTSARKCSIRLKIQAAFPCALGPAQFGVIQAAAPSFKVEVNPLNMRNAADIERDVAIFARSRTSGGLIVTASGLATLYRDLIVALAARHRLPAVYPERNFAAAGGLIS
jgi:hypothetical protein